MIKVNKEITKKALDKYGVYVQLNVVNEEMSELIQALSKAVRASNGDESVGQPFEVFSNILSEVADVYVVLDSVREIFSLSENDIQRKINEKQRRLLERM